MMEIKFGALQNSIATQLKAQDIPFDSDKVKSYQALSHSIGMLYVHGVIIESERDNAYNRLYKKIANHVKKFNKY